MSNSNLSQQWGTLTAGTHLTPQVHMSMHPAEIVAELTRAQLILHVDTEGHLRVNGPQAALTREVQTVLLYRQPDILAHIQDLPLPLNYGLCCACGSELVFTSEHTLMLPWKALVPGTGWGCHGCGIPFDGALAVLCRGCAVSKRPVRHAVVGRLPNPERILLRELCDPQLHPASHP